MLPVGASALDSPAPLQWQSSGRIGDSAVAPASHSQADTPPAPRRPERRAGAGETTQTNPSAPKAPAYQAPPRRVAETPSVVEPTAVAARASGVLRAAGAAAASQASPRVAATSHAVPVTGVEGDIAYQHDNAAQQVCHSAPCDGFACGDAACGDAVWGDPACGCGEIGCAGECEPTCGCAGDCTCGLRSIGGCAERGAIPIVLWIPPIHELTLQGGVHAFKGALDNGRDRGNFGFHGGVNAGGRMAWLPWWGLGYQLGYQATGNQLHGDTATFSSDSHTQQFLTGGLFHRKPVGLQYGVVYDWLQDERQGTADFGQVRGLVSIRGARAGELGFTFTHGTNTNILQGATYEALDQYMLFYRMIGPQGGDFRLLGGFDDEGRGLLGADASLPLNHRWSVDAGFKYLIADESVRGSGGAEEAWNLGINLVWHYGKRAKSSFRSPFRPMFSVADNGSMIVDDRD
jgi:hypothetical protein